MARADQDRSSAVERKLAAAGDPDLEPVLREAVEASSSELVFPAPDGGMVRDDFRFADILRSRGELPARRFLKSVFIAPRFAAASPLRLPSLRAAVDRPPSSPGPARRGPGSRGRRWP